ncbi:hypothetical protein EIN_053800 [Entamoeba invadens IP1]|uniref:hypothetical protein n=1 Tax=Entamoeba invadens IP1 TaxID=370355 RepID=UPI0002C3DB7B|nr:hypothetical protein EIN_053800 [Entamoeba invadens IP1]ELP93125.1 hypothetical protein EIN_053800 [Entamoeba invadens IP1]|eukprot:XP_004259896.1 hypothetical protein EIN_053800 [Entamoeba invadens IP1]
MDTKNLISLYNKNLYSNIIELAQKASAIGTILKTVENTFLELENTLEGFLEQFPTNDTPGSFVSLVTLSLNANIAVRSQFTILSDKYRKFSEKLKNPWDWEELISSFDKIKTQQLHSIFNIHAYRCLEEFLRVIKTFGESDDIKVLLDDAKIRPFTSSADRLVNERKRLLNVEYMLPVTDLVKFEERPPTLLPLYFEKIMYKMYFEKGDMEGAFRQCAGKDEMEQYMQYFGVVDCRLMDHVLIAAILKKYLREAPSPVWPISLYDQLVEMTGQTGTNLAMWKMKFRALYNSVPTENKTFLEHFVALCLQICKNPTSKMSPKNLAICTAPGLIRNKPMNGDYIETPHQHVFVAFTNMLVCANDIFPQISMKFIESRLEEVLNPPSVFKDIFEARSGRIVRNTPPIRTNSANRRLAHQRFKPLPPKPNRLSSLSDDSQV